MLSALVGFLLFVLLLKTPRLSDGCDFILQAYFHFYLFFNFQKPFLVLSYLIHFSLSFTVGSIICYPLYHFALPFYFTISPYHSTISIYLPPFALPFYSSLIREELLDERLLSGADCSISAPLKSVCLKLNPILHSKRFPFPQI